MSRAKQCDVCKGTEYVKFTRRRYFWQRYDYDSQGGSNTELDVCDNCWKAFEIFCKESTHEKES